MFTFRFFAKRFLANGCLGGFLSITVLSMGCGGGRMVCNVAAVVVFNVSPATASVNHAAASPGNSQAFAAQTTSSPCGNTTVTPASSNWTASDPSVQLSASPNTQVTATCTAALASPVTITATDTNNGLTGHAMLTCN